ncbi:MAG TPA: BREX-4 system phosphatase PglZ [Bacteroidales bacterium]|nr:BREX-4 system phosphatase PglZ [Bacteroidales bacterium]
MLVKVNTVEELLEVIKADKNLSGEKTLLQRRYPVRFILFNDFSLYKETIGKLCQNHINIKKIENELPFEDGWVTRLEMRNLIESCLHDINSDIVVSPFSEIIRFYDDADFISFFKEVSMIEANAANLDRRVYLPIIGLEHRLTKFKNLTEGAVIWELLIDNPKQYPIYVTKDYSIPIPEDITHIKTSKEWLELWRGNFPKKKILCSSSPILNNHKNSQPDTIFNLELIANEHDFLLKVFNLQSSIHYKVGDEKYWQILLTRFQDIKSVNFSLDQFTLDHFNIKHFKPTEFLRLWFNYKDDFSRWLLVRNFEVQNNINSLYLGQIISHLEDYTDNSILENICFDIFQLEPTTDIIEERDKFLKLIHQEKVPIPESISETLKSKIAELLVSDFSTALKLCSGTFEYEKELLINFYSEGKMKKEQLQNAYPLLYEYLKETPDLNLNEGQKWISQYIDEYKNAKILNKYTSKIKEFIHLKNKDEYSFFDWYMPIRTPQSALSSFDIDKFYWIDGIGVEWISLIYETIKKHTKLSVVHFEITKTNLPSTTEINRYPDYEKKGDLDSFIHQNLYKYPNSIIAEINLVYSIIEDIISKLHNQTIAIVSDHGFTSLPRLVDSKRLNLNDEHEGRCALADPKFNISSEDYIVYKNSSSKYIVALKHASIGDKPKRESHGGCTPEEVLVPTIIISDKIKRDTSINSGEIDVKAKNIKDNSSEKGYEEIDLF